MVTNTGQALKAARQFVRSVKKSGIRLEGAYLFGSYAKGNPHPESDIDVALISPDFSGWVDDIEKIRTAILEKDPRIESVRFRPDTFCDENPLAWEVKTTGIPLIGKNDKRRAITKPKNRRAKRA